MSEIRKGSSRDPALVAYRAFLNHSGERKTIENSLLISLCIFLLLLFITFPELASQIIQAARPDDEISEIPLQKIIEPEEKEPPQVEERYRRDEKEYTYTVPSVTAPRATDTIVRVMEPGEKLDIHDSALDGIGFDDELLGEPPWIKVAGPIEKPRFREAGPLLYPQRARMLRKEGTVRLQVKISRQGEMVEIFVLQEQPPDFGFGEAAINYFKKGRWIPARQNGRPINAVYNFVFSFQLD